MELVSVNDWPKPFQYAPFQPSPNESVIKRVHTLPVLTANALLCGLPPLSVCPLPQLRDHATSEEYEPPEHVTALVIDVSVGGGGGSGGNEGSGALSDVTGGAEGGGRGDGGSRRDGVRDGGGRGRGGGGGAWTRNVRV